MLSIQVLKPRQSWSPRPCVRYQNGNSQALEHIYIKLISKLVEALCTYVSRLLCRLIIILVLDPCYARATVVRARFLAAAFSDGSYLAHVNGAYLRHIKFSIVRGPPLFIVGRSLPRLVQSPRRRTPASPILV